MIMSPYKSLPNTSFWKRAVAIDRNLVDPVVDSKFRIDKSMKIATAGSCFAQHIARSLSRQGFHYLVTEQGDDKRNFGLFSARFGNIYTVRQLYQLFRRTYGLFEPVDLAWRRDDGAFVDPFRPQVEPEGFPSIEALCADRDAHFAAVRAMFESCDILIFTLGLTESWRSTRDGAVFPLAPGVSGYPHDQNFEFHNFSVAEMTEDMEKFLNCLRAVNPGARVILTVSPVPLVATYEKKHVLTATTYSKSALRIVAEEAVNAHKHVDYFPSYEIITGHHNGYRFFDRDLRSVLPDGVDSVMSIFSQHYLAGSAGAGQPANLSDAGKMPVENRTSLDNSVFEAEMNELYRIVCDEEALDR